MKRDDDAMDAGAETGRGTVHFIGAGPGDPDLITVRGRDLIARCPVCLFAGSLVPRAVVAYAPPGATVRNTASMTLDQIVELMDEATSKGLDVARVHSGDPGLYGAVAEQIRRLDALGVPHEIVPGVSSFSAAAAALGIELTPAGVNQTVILTRASGRTGLPSNECLAELARHRVGMCLFLSAAQMPEVVSALEPHYGPEAPVVVAHRVTWPDQRILRGTLADIAGRMSEAEITMTALVLVGPMLDPSGAGESHLYDRTYSHTYRKASR
jgi:precorrin-4/cobalt-precorrin-4 C11-methyltransferase